jgi:serine/threonine protein phosphatase PrpC
VQSRDSIALGDVLLDLTVSARSETGQVRAMNEDSFVATVPIFLVADGMGGHDRGDRASQEVARVFTDTFGGATPTTPEAILDAIWESNRSVREQSAAANQLSGTTLAGIALVQASGGASHHWMAFNIGDSRIYVWDGRTLTQLSVDHSAVQELVDAGELTPAEAAAHPDRNVITRAIGAEEGVDPDVWLLPAAGTQTFLICSDGLTKELEDDEIASVLVHHGSVDDSSSIADALVSSALDRGGRDNVTVLVIESVLASSPNEGTTIDPTQSRSAILDDTLPRS